MKKVDDYLPTTAPASKEDERDMKKLLAEKHMELWRRVEKTDPAHTKEVKLGRKFTSIDAYWNIQRMTEIFGACGEGWGYEVDYSVLDVGFSYIASADVTLWYMRAGQRCEFGPIRGANVLAKLPMQLNVEELADHVAARASRSDGAVNTTGIRSAISSASQSMKGFIDEDAFKKALTDALGKLMSHLGFSADVFLGRYDDDKYVQAMAREFEYTQEDKEKAMRYLPEMRTAIGNDDGMGMQQLVDELCEGENRNPWICLFGMLSTEEKERVRQLKGG